MMTKLLERFYCGSAYWDYRALMIAFETYKENDETTIELIIGQLDDLYYKKMSWLERHMSEAFFRERTKQNALLQE